MITPQEPKRNPTLDRTPYSILATSMLEKESSNRRSILKSSSSVACLVCLVSCDSPYVRCSNCFGDLPRFACDGHTISFEWMKEHRKLALTRAYLLLRDPIDHTVREKDWIQLMAFLRPDCDKGWVRLR